jgi:hypothetical protein
VSDQLACPDLLAGLGVNRDEVAVDVGEEDLAFVVDGRGDVGRRAGVLRVGGAFPEDLAIAQPHPLGIAELVDHVGDAVGDRGRELDQRVGIDRPGFAQRRIERPPGRRGKVVRALGDAAEERPGDEAGLGWGGGRCLVAAGAAAPCERAETGHDHEQQSERSPRQEAHPLCIDRSGRALSARHPPPASRAADGN